MMRYQIKKKHSPKKGISLIPTQINKQTKIIFCIYFQRKLILHVINQFKDWRIHIAVLITSQSDPCSSPQVTIHTVKTLQCQKV